MRQLMHVVKRPYLYYRFQPSLSEANNALDDTSNWNIQDLKRRAEIDLRRSRRNSKKSRICAGSCAARRRVQIRRGEMTTSRAVAVAVR